MTGNVLPVTSPAPREDTAYSYDELRATTPEIGVDLPAFRAPNTVLKSFLIIICMFGFIANSAMLVSLLMKKRGAAGKTVNVFVCNQTILELVATFVLVVKQSLTMSGYLDRNAGVLRMLPAHKALERTSQMRFQCSVTCMRYSQPDLSSHLLFYM